MMVVQSVKLSIIVPVYNTEAYLRKCIDSILDIPIENKEIIVVNDGSTDNSLNILNTYTDLSIKVINTPNGGLSSARNIGIEHAVGEYILFVDSDDYVISSKIINLVKLADEYDLEIIIGDYIKYSDSGQILSKNDMSVLKKNVVLKGNELYDQYSLNDIRMITACFKLYRRDFIYQNKLCFVKGLYHEDVLFSFLCSKHVTRIMVTDIVFYAYLQRSQSIVHTPSFEKQIHKMYISNYICSNIEDSDSEFWSNLAVGIYFDVMRKSKLRNKELTKKIVKCKKMRMSQILKVLLILLMQYNAKEVEIKV